MRIKKGFGYPRLELRVVILVLLTEERPLQGKKADCILSKSQCITTFFFHAKNDGRR